MREAANAQTRLFNFDVRLSGIACCVGPARPLLSFDIDTAMFFAIALADVVVPKDQDTSRVYFLEFVIEDICPACLEVSICLSWFNCFPRF
jgi:hypothetical protein